MSEARPLKELTAEPVDEAQLSRNWRAIQRRRAAPARPPRWAMGLGAAAMAAAVALFVLWPDDAAEGPLMRADGAPFEAVERVTELADGSRISLEPWAEVEVLESSAQRVVLRLVHGRARFEVTPGGPRRWIVEAGEARVEVVGTVFSVDRRGEWVEVSVERGVVLVRGEELPDGVRRLAAGERVHVGRSELAARDEAPDVQERALAQADVEPERVAPEPVEPVAADEAPRVSPPETTPQASPSPSPREPSEAAPPRPRPRASAAELMARADAARGEGDHRRAADALERLLDRYPTDGRAPMAAVTLGRLELRQLRRPGRAADAFARALAMRLPRSLDEDVRAQRVEALARAGRTEAASRAAAEYHRRYPDGRWTSEVQRWAP